MPLNVLNEKKLYLIKKPRFKSLCLISLTQYRHSKLDLIYVRNIENAKISVQTYQNAQALLAV